MLLCLLASGMAFVSCGDDDDDDKAWLVGTWSTRLYFEETDDDYGSSYILKLNEDGTCLSDDEEENFGRWSYTDSKLIVTFQEERLVFHIGDKTKNSFKYNAVWEECDDYYGGWSTFHFKGTAYRISY